MEWLHDGKKQHGALEVADGWRKTNLTWRPSMLDILPSMPFSGDDLTDGREEGARPSREARRDPPGRGRSRDARAVGIKGGDVIIGFDGKAVDGTMRDLLGFVRRNYLVGDAIIINVIRDGKRLDLKHVLK